MAKARELVLKRQFCDSALTGLDIPLKKRYETEETVWKSVSSKLSFEIALKQSSVLECSENDNLSELVFTHYRKDYQSNTIHRIETAATNESIYISSTGNNDNVESDMKTVTNDIKNALDTSFSLVGTCDPKSTESRTNTIHNLVGESYQKLKSVVFDSNETFKKMSSSNFDVERHEIRQKFEMRDVIVQLDRFDATKQPIIAREEMRRDYVETSCEIKKHSVIKLQKVEKNCRSRNEAKTELCGSKRRIKKNFNKTEMETYTQRITNCVKDRNDIFPVKKKRGRPRKNATESGENTISHWPTDVNYSNSVSFQKKRRLPKKNAIGCKVGVHQSDFTKSSDSKPMRKKRGLEKNIIECKENVGADQSNFTKFSDEKSPQKKRGCLRKNPFQIKDINRLDDKRMSSFMNKNSTAKMTLALTDVLERNSWYPFRTVMTRSKAAICGDAYEFASLPAKRKNRQRQLKAKTKTEGVDCMSVASPTDPLREENNQPGKKKIGSFKNPTVDEKQLTQHTPSAAMVEVRLLRCDVPSSTPYSGHCERLAKKYKITNRSGTMMNVGSDEEMSINSFETKFSHYSHLSESVSITPIKTYKRMTRGEAEEKTQRHYKRKKSFIDDSINSRASKLIAVKKIQSTFANPSPIPKYLRYPRHSRSKSPHSLNDTLRSIQTPTLCIKLTKLSADDISSYVLTPLPEERIPIAPKTADDYGIDDVNTDASTDDEEFPKKRVPAWCKNVKNGVLQIFKFQSAVRRSLVSQWMHPPKHEDSLHSVFFA